MGWFYGTGVGCLGPAGGTQRLHGAPTGVQCAACHWYLERRVQRIAREAGGVHCCLWRRFCEAEELIDATAGSKTFLIKDVDIHSLYDMRRDGVKKACVL